MIVELVEFVHPAGTSRADVIESARTTLPHWQADPDLLRKHYLLGTDGRSGAGLYFWTDIAAARRAHSADWVAAAEQRTGQAVRIRHFELLMTLDNVARRVLDEADEAPAASRSPPFTGKTP